MLKKIKIIVGYTINRLTINLPSLGKIALVGFIVIPAMFCNSTVKVQDCEEQVMEITENKPIQEQESIDVSSIQYIKKPLVFVPDELSEPQIVTDEPEDITEKEEVLEDYTMFTTSRVNMRTSNDINSDVISKLEPSVMVMAHKTKGDWTYISYNNMEGWIYSDYLKVYDPENYIDIGLNYECQDLIRESIQTFGLDVDEYFFYGMIYVESRFNTNQTSCADAQGLLQVIPKTWDSYYPELCRDYPELASKYVVDDPYDASSNLVMGIYCMYRNMNYLGVSSLSDNASMVLTSYNRGPGGANSYYRENGTYSSSYSRNVLRASDFIRTNKYWKEGI